MIKDEKPRARVFISCGQDKATDEPEIASEIKNKLSDLGFDPYVAVVEQTLKGLKDNLFKRLKESEYFVFVDFKRERLDSTDLHRGSLFSHQELAIAASFDIEVIALQEQGVKKLDGMLSALQANPITFSRREEVSELVAQEVKQRMCGGKWDPCWKNELVLVQKPDYFTDPIVREINATGKFFHIGVHNRHRSKIAMDCRAYLECAIDLQSGREIALKIVELKWEGYMLPYAHVQAMKERKFDAFWLLHDHPSVLQFSCFCDASNFMPQISTPGTYQLDYLVLANNFPPVRKSFKLTLDAQLAKTTFEPV